MGSRTRQGQVNGALCFFILFLLFSWSFKAKASEAPQFEQLKTVLEQDGLMKEAEKQKQESARLEEIKKARLRANAKFPEEKDFWGALSEWWLIKNQSTLKWDFDRPDYDLVKTVDELFRSVGLIETHYRVLVINSPQIFHLALPGIDKKVIFIVSLPFMRSLDLSKIEIALLLLEDYQRMEEGFLQEALKLEELPDAESKEPKKLTLSTLLERQQGQSLEKMSVGIKLFHQTAELLEIFLQKKGFTFQQQYLVTKRMDQLLKSLPHLWNQYFLVLGKIDKLIKANQLFDDYVRLYPSPEMQLKWLSPKEKVI